MTTRGMNNAYMAASWWRKRIVAVVVAAGIVLAVILAVAWIVAPGASTTRLPKASDVVGGFEGADASPPAVSRVMASEDDIGAADFWRNMVESTECHLVTDGGGASGTAMVIGPARPAGPAGGGSVFRVINGDGTLFEGELPFKPGDAWLRKGIDGHVLAGFSDLRSDSGMRRHPASPEPVVVYRDGEEIYQTRKAWSFGVDSGGSAFFTIEPEADDTSQLIIRDADGAVMRSHDLGREFTPENDAPPFLARFTNDGGEIMLAPGSIYQNHMFYPVGEGKSRAILYRGEKNLWGGVIPSSRTGFYVYARSDYGPLLVVRERFNWESKTERISEVWATVLDLIQFYGGVHLSSDNRYLLLEAWNAHLLDARTGQVLFAYPTALNLMQTPGGVRRDMSAVADAYEQADRERLAGVVPLREDQDPGAIESYGFRDGALYIHRRIGVAASRECTIQYGSDLERREACMERLRASGEYSEALDLFDLADIQIDSPPDRRVAASRDEHACRPGPKSGLVFDGGILGYVGRED